MTSKVTDFGGERAVLPSVACPSLGRGNFATLRRRECEPRPVSSGCAPVRGAWWARCARVLCLRLVVPSVVLVLVVLGVSSLVPPLCGGAQELRLFVCPSLSVVVFCSCFLCGAPCAPMGAYGGGLPSPLIG